MFYKLHNMRVNLPTEAVSLSAYRFGGQVTLDIMLSDVTKIVFLILKGGEHGVGRNVGG